MKLLHASDLHLGVTRYGVGDSRLRDAEATLGRIADDADQYDVAAVILSGDTFDSRRPGPEWLRAFGTFVSRLSDRRLIIVPGNHDGMTTVGDPETHALLWLDSLRLPNVDVLTEPGLSYVGLGEHEPGLWVFALPYPHKRGLDALLRDMPVDERATEVGRRVEDAIRALAVRPDPDVDPEAPMVFVGHVSLVGAKLGSEAAMRMGWDAMIDPGCLAPFDYAALGHIHRRQQVAPNAWYAGSPEYLDFGDAGGDKGWLYVEAEPGEPPRVRPLDNVGVRPLLDIEAAQDADGDLVMRPNPGHPLWSRGPVVRLVVTATVDRPTPQAIAGLVRWLREEGASFVKTVVRLDLPAVGGAEQQEVDPEADTLDLLAGWLAARGHPAEPTMTVGRTLLASLDDA